MGRFPTLNAYDVSGTSTTASPGTHTRRGSSRTDTTGRHPRTSCEPATPTRSGWITTSTGRALDRPFWVMEQQPGDVNWPPHCPQPGEGAMRLWAHHAAAHGADAVPLLQVAALSRGSRTVSRRTPEGRRVARPRIRRRRTHVRGVRDSRRGQSRGRPGGGCFDYDSLWALNAQPPHARTSTTGRSKRHSTALYARPWRSGRCGSAKCRSLRIRGRRRARTPPRYRGSRRPADRLHRRRREVLFGPRTGVKDAENKLRPMSQPGLLTDLVGATVDQHESLPRRLETTVRRVGDPTDDSRRIAAPPVVRTWAGGWTPMQPSLSTRTMSTGRRTVGRQSLPTQSVTGKSLTVESGPSLT